MLKTVELTRATPSSAHHIHSKSEPAETGGGPTLDVNYATGSDGGLLCAKWKLLQQTREH